MEIKLEYKTSTISEFVIHIPIESIYAGVSMMLDDNNIIIDY